MPNPPPKSYGAPLGPQAPVARDRPKVGPADPATIHRNLDAYEKRLQEEHARIQHVRKAIPRPPADPAANANRRGSIPGVEAALKKSGA